MIELLKTLIVDFQSYTPSGLIDRDLEVPVSTGSTLAIIGPRRAGKTWFLHTIIRSLRQTIDPRRILFLDFEDERLNLNSETLHLITDAYSQLYPDIPLEDVYFFFDEVQAAEGWQKFIRRISEYICSNIFITGSSSRLFSTEIATEMRGRSVAYTLLPLSFREYLRFREREPSGHPGTVESNRLQMEFGRFLRTGGFPGVQKHDDVTRRRILQAYVDTMLLRDIIERFNIGPAVLVREIGRRIMATSSRTLSINRIYNDLRSRGISVGKDTLYEFVSCFEDAFFAFFIRKFDRSHVKRERALRKVYANDTGLLGTFRTGGGHMLETSVCLELLKRGKTPLYSTNGCECDFVIEDESGRVSELIQVCDNLTLENRKQEIRGLVRHASYFELESGTIVTGNIEETFIEDGIRISVIPAWKWCLGK
jgi:predicted AAA+ superfamily ATPase